jgi:hypothetical protein
MPLRRDDVRAILEDVDPDTISRVVATGATLDELAEALHRISDRAQDETPSSGRVLELEAVLRDAASS